MVEGFRPAGLCQWVELCPFKGRVQVLTLMPVEVTLPGNRVFADVRKPRLSRGECPGFRVGPDSRDGREGRGSERLRNEGHMRTGVGAGVMRHQPGDTPWVPWRLGEAIQPLPYRAPSRVVQLSRETRSCEECSCSGPASARWVLMSPGTS